MDDEENKIKKKKVQWSKKSLTLRKSRKKEEIEEEQDRRWNNRMLLREWNGMKSKDINHIMAFDEWNNQCAPTWHGKNRKTNNGSLIVVILLFPVCLVLKFEGLSSEKCLFYHVLGAVMWYIQRLHMH